MDRLSKQVNSLQYSCGRLFKVRLLRNLRGEVPKQGFQGD